MSATSSTAFFFTELYIKANTAITANVDYQDIVPFIQTSQEMLVKERIGKVLYERLCQAIILRDWTDNELELITLCRPWVAFYCVYSALPFLQTKIKNKGLVRGTDQFVQTITTQDQLNLRQEFLQYSNYYGTKVDEYLCLYSSNFPQYSDPSPLNNKTHNQEYDMGGFGSYKGNCYGLGSDVNLIMKTIGYYR